MCENPPAAPIAELLRQAFVIAGQSVDQVISGANISRGMMWLNAHLAQMSSNNKTIPYIKNLTFQGDGEKGDFIIGKIPNADIFANSFNDIINVNYTVGQLHYECEYMPPKSFDTIVFRENTTYPLYYSFEVQDNYTLLRICPKPPAGFVMRVRGKQKLSSVTLFQEEDELPSYTFIYLAHAIAPNLLPITGGVLYSRFDKTFSDAEKNLFSANKQDVQEELVPAMMPGLMGNSRYGFVRSGGGGGYFG